jgi:CheY-like chemotaxis protein
MSQQDLIGYTVLVIDEDAFLAKIIVSVLGAFDFGSVIYGRSVEEARDILSTSRVDCVVCDWLSESGKGLELVDFLRQDENSPGPEMPIVLCTALTEMTNICQVRDKGISEIVAKPFSPKHLIDKILAALFRRRTFVAVEAYTGPDRRRRNLAWDGEERRGQYGLNQDQIDSVMQKEITADDDQEMAANG